MGNSVRRALVVDDQPALCTLLRRLIQRTHPQAVVVYASDAASAQWQINSTTLELVLTDMCLGSDREGGVAVVDMALTAGIPVAVITGAGATLATEGLASRGIPILAKETIHGEAFRSVVAKAFGT